MKNIKESILSNLIAVETGVGLADKLGKSMKDKNRASVKAAKKLIDNDPSLKKNIEDLKRISDKIKADTDKQIKKLPPESQEYLKKLFG